MHSLVLLAALVPGLAHAQAVRGRLLEWPGDRPIANGTITIFDREGNRIASATTHLDGAFILAAPVGRALVLHGSAPGFFDMLSDDTLEFAGADTLDIEFRLRIMPVTLEGIEAEVASGGATNPVLARTGFYQRRKLGLGGFITRDDVEKRPDTQRITDLLLAMRGVFSTGDGLRFRAPAESLTGGCTPRVYVDGLLSSLTLSFDFAGINSIPLDALEAIEVYRGVAEVPAQYGGAQGTCGVVLVWTR